MIRFGSLFSGIEAASCAFVPLKWEAAWFSEIDPFCCSLLSERFPSVPNLGDVTADDFSDRARALNVLRAAGAPMHVQEILKKLGDSSVKRSHVVSELERAIKRGLVVRPAPGTYAVVEVK